MPYNNSEIKYFTKTWGNIQKIGSSHVCVFLLNFYKCQPSFHDDAFWMDGSSSEQQRILKLTT